MEYRSVSFLHISLTVIYSSACVSVPWELLCTLRINPICGFASPKLICFDRMGALFSEFAAAVNATGRLFDPLIKVSFAFG